MPVSSNFFFFSPNGFLVVLAFLFFAGVFDSCVHPCVLDGFFLIL